MVTATVYADNGGDVNLRKTPSRTGALIQRVPTGQTVTVEDMTGLTAKEAESLLKQSGLTAKMQGSAEYVTAQIPHPGSVVAGDSEILLYFGETTAQRMVKVPDFTGMNRQQAVEAAGKLGLYVLPEGNKELLPGVVVTFQSHIKDTQVPAGTVITLTFTDISVQD